jgi:hypothetical protein
VGDRREVIDLIAWNGRNGPGYSPILPVFISKQFKESSKIYKEIKG